MAEFVHPPSADVFSEVLSQEGPKWFDIGVYLGAPTADLREIRQNYSTHGIVTCLIELHECLTRKGLLSWERIATALRRLGNNTLADSIHSSYILPTIRHALSSENSSTTSTTTVQAPMASDNHVAHSSDPQQQLSVVIKDDGVDEIFGELHSLSNRFDCLTLKIGRSFKEANSGIDLEEMQALVERQCGLPPLPQNEVTVVNVFNRLQKECSVLKFHPLTFAVDNLLSNKKTLRKELTKLEKAVNRFKKFENMVTIVSRIKSHATDNHKRVKLKLRNSWIQFTIEQFEIMMNEILGTLYELLSHITVGTGCICVSWNIPPSVDYTKLLPKLSLEFLQIIGVISLHIGDNVIYNVGKEGCQTLEASMLQAIELKNTRAIELLLAVGCRPEVATYNGDHFVTNVTNIRERSVDDSCGGGVNHTCVLGHNELIEAIVDTSRESECAACRMKEKQIKQLYISMQVERKDHAEIKKLTEKLQEKTKLADTLQLKNKDLSLEIETVSSEYDAYQAKKDVEIEELTEQLKDKDAELTKTMEQLKFKDDSEMAEDSTEQLLRSKLAESASLNSALTEQIKTKDAAFTALMIENKQLRELSLVKSVTESKTKLSLSVGSCTAVLPCQRLLGIGGEMKVKVITRDSDGKQLTNGGSAIRTSLACNKEECPVTDNGDGTYLVSVVPHQLKQHFLSITVDGGHIKDSPFALNIVQRRDYTHLEKPSQTITGIEYPQYIAFSDNGDMFVTNSGDHCIHVYDKSGNRKTTIGSKGTGELQFQSPHGISISNGVVYVAEYDGHRIHMLTTGGEFIGTFGERGSGKRHQFGRPHVVKISPDGRVYITDEGNNCVHVFNPDWTISHVIDSSNVPEGVRLSPRAIAFDLSGDIHVTLSAGYHSVTVFTPAGQFVRHYGGSKLRYLEGIAIDPSGYSLVASWFSNTISVYDPSGSLECSIKGFHCPTGVSISPDGSVWVVDAGNYRLVKYT